LKILVIGDSCTDTFVYGNCSRLCPEAPIPVFTPSKTITNQGMAGNVVENLRALGVRKTELITNNEQIIKTRYVETKSNQMLLRVDGNDKVSNTFDYRKVDFDSYDAVIVSDYDKGYLTYEDIGMIGEKSKLSFIDTKKTIGSGDYFKNYTFVKMNEEEWDNCVLMGAIYSEWKDNLIVTMSERGCMYNEKRYPVDNSIEVRDLSGAGDTWMASFVYEYVQSGIIDKAIDTANKNATIVVQRRGVSTI
jgi:D-beta-D-heptose 7-phosphate kinase/D-beta-D-heptose 1-phosphate adenosyltransferase|tara:strand:- start:7571 stop:8314 length:744 start_codon:yes stop_codon:yes gene_type:complete